MLIAPHCTPSLSSTPMIWRAATVSIMLVSWQRRGPAGAVAENVAMGCETEACARRMWMQSPPHRANMMLGGCQAVASAVSASGRRYWAMEIGGNSRVDTRHAGATLARAARRGSGHDGVVGRDFSIDGSNAP